MTTENYFSNDYGMARQRFREAVAARSGRLDSMKLAATGPQGEDLTIDIAWFGSQKPRRVFVHSSGLHGVEAFSGCAIQLQYLREGFGEIPEDAAIVLVHVLNPYGMAWLRRFNENNVDLNRNFRRPNDGNALVAFNWQQVDALLNPANPPAKDGFYFRAVWLVLRYGMRSVKQSVAGGQCRNPKGLFFTGYTMEEGPTKFQNFIQEHLSDAERIVAIDVHTGLGRFGQDRLLVDSALERADANRSMRQAYGERMQLLDRESVAYPVAGAQHDMYYRLFPNAKIYFASQEFGTYKPLRVVEALRAENRWHHYGDKTTSGAAIGRVDHPTKKVLLEVFNPKDPKWRQSVLLRGKEVIRQACTLAFVPEGGSVR